MADPLKTAIRKTCFKIRKQLSLQYQEKISKLICRNIETLSIFQQSKCIGFYHAINGEIDLKYLFNKALLKQKLCYFPRIETDKTLTFLPVRFQTPFKKNQMGILEPVESETGPVQLNAIDLLIMPLVAFDVQCERIGMGAGYYDRTLANERPKFLLGVAYDFQCQTYIHPESWDIPLDAIMTEKKFYERNQ